MGNIDSGFFSAMLDQGQIHSQLVRVILRRFSRICQVFFISRRDNLHPFIIIANQGQTLDFLLRVRISEADSELSSKGYNIWAAG